jgi:hypothetical protein
MRKLLGLGLLAAAAIACAGRVVSVDSAAASSGGAGIAGSPSTGGVPAPGGTSGTGELPATGGSAGASLPGLVPFDVSNDITTTDCAGKVYEPELRPVILQMLVDVSSSMTEPPPGPSTGRTKWEITRDALIAALDHLPAAAALGVSFYPNQTTPNNPLGPASDDHSLCIDASADLPITRLGTKTSQQRADIVNRLNAITIPLNAGTPTHDAYRLALASVLNLANTDPTYAGIPKYVLLITDGQPTISLGCLGYGREQYPVDPAPIISDIGEAFTNHQIRTFIIGSPGSEKVYVVDGGSDARLWLSEAATAGGTADFQPGCTNTGAPTYCHFDMTTAADFDQALGTALQKITSSLAPCEYAVIPPEGTVIDPTLVSVVYTDADSVKYGVVANQTTGDCTVGWRYADSTGTKLEICRDTCQVISNDPFARVSVLLGCRSIVIPW